MEKKGHLSRDCHQPIKFNRGRGRSGDRGALRGGGGRGGRRSYRANFATTEEGSESNTQGKPTSSGNVANDMHSNSGILN